VIDTAAREVKHKIKFEIPGVPTEAIQPVGVRIKKDRSLAFVALGPANRVAAIDAKTYEVKKYLLVGQRVWQLGFSPDEKFIYSTNGVSNDITVIDVDNLESVQSVPVGTYPWGIAVRD
jgi:YVTN family beta-propeller protein